jgi:hypothetical protein
MEQKLKEPETALKRLSNCDSLQSPDSIVRPTLIQIAEPRVENYQKNQID